MDVCTPHSMPPLPLLFEDTAAAAAGAGMGAALAHCMGWPANREQLVAHLHAPHPLLLLLLLLLLMMMLWLMEGRL
jgi:hypothetical protein